MEKIKGSDKMFKKIKKFLNRSIENKYISYKKLKELMKDEDVYLIDVRSNQEYEEGHLNGAINIPSYNIKMQIAENVQDKLSTIILYCSTGHRSEISKKILDELGYKNVFCLEDGIEKIWLKGM